VLIAVVLGTLFWGLQQALHVPIDKSLDELREKYPNLNFIQLKDGRIMEYHESGDKNGKPILCIQGTLQTGYSMCNLLHPFFIQHGLRAICPTLPGSAGLPGTKTPFPHTVKILQNSRINWV